MSVNAVSKVGDAALETVPLSIDVRPPPLHPKRSAVLHMLAAGNGSLFAGVRVLPFCSTPKVAWSSSGATWCTLQLVHAVGSHAPSSAPLPSIAPGPVSLGNDNIGFMHAAPAASGSFIQWAGTGGEPQLPHPNRQQVSTNVDGKTKSAKGGHQHLSTDCKRLVKAPAALRP